MPSGDPQRTWFPEMIEILRARWSDTMPFEELIELTAELDANLQAIRTARDIQPPMMWCPNCRRRHRSADPRVSVRATILAWGRFGVVSPEAVKALENAEEILAHVVTPHGTRTRISRHLLRGKNPLPAKLAVLVRVLALQSVRKIDAAEPGI